MSMIYAELKKELEKNLDANGQSNLFAGISFALGVIARLESVGQETDVLFEQFWKIYPRRIAKKNALKVWLRLKIDEPLYLKIIDALDKVRRTPQWQNLQYIPHPATWLSQERWNDEVESVTSVPTDTKYKHI